MIKMMKYQASYWADSMIRPLTIIATVLLLTACAAPRIPVPDPTPLTDITPSVELESRWASTKVQISSKKNRDFLALRPTLAGNQLIAVSVDGEVLALDTANGQSIWQSQLNHRIVAGVGAGEGIVVVVSDAGVVLALDINDGAALWEYQLSEVVFAPPLVYRERVVLRTIDGNLVALSATDGEFLWDAIYDQPEFLEFGSASPIGYQNAVIIGNATGRVIATEVNTGFDAWQLYLGSERSIGALRSRESHPLVFENNMILSDLARAIVTYDLSTGNVMWESRRPAGRNLAVDSTRVYGHDTDSLVFAVNRNDGTLVWQQNALLHRGVDDIALVGGRLVVSDRLGFLHVLDQSSGAIIGRSRIRERVPSDGLIASGNSLYIFYRSGRIEALSLQAGE